MFYGLVLLAGWVITVLTLLVWIGALAIDSVLWLLKRWEKPRTETARPTATPVTSVNNKAGQAPSNKTPLAMLAVGLLSIVSAGWQTGAAGSGDKGSTRKHREELRDFAQANRGDLVRGEKVIEKLDCRLCHRIGGQGGSSAPALDDHSLSREEIIGQLLEPSRGRNVRVVFPSGRSQIFVLVKETAKALEVLDPETKDAQVLDKAALEEVKRIKTRMPSLFDDVSEQDFADVVEYVEKRRQQPK